ncbi:RHG32 protein, partial [Buphagus erythrorhynchus]|nr:RHG32 protein [Buphagus erythrorhynchus]
SNPFTHFSVLIASHEFDSEQIPDLTKDIYIQDIHCVGSLCKLYFRELPNPLLTYQLYEKFSGTALYPGPSLCWCPPPPRSCSHWRRLRHGHRPRSTLPSWQTASTSKWEKAQQLCRGNSTQSLTSHLKGRDRFPFQ